ncbi:hypothetical protein L3Q82_023181, partial [Scortum barcoo]
GPSVRALRSDRWQQGRGRTHAGGSEEEKWAGLHRHDSATFERPFPVGIKTSTDRRSCQQTDGRRSRKAQRTALRRPKMVQDNAQIRLRGAQDFMAYYDFVCARQESAPVPAIKMNLDKGMLDFNGDRVKLTDWPPILSSISINKHLHHIAISSTYQASLGSGDPDRRYYKSTFKKKIPAIRSKDMTFKLCKALRDCLTVSPNLKTLQLNGLPLRERDLITLTKRATTIPVCHSRGTVPKPPCNVAEACQPRQPHNIQRLEVLRADLIHPRRLATEELANYLSDFGSGDGRVHLRVPSLRFLTGRQVGLGLRRSSKYFFHRPTMSPVKGLAKSVSLENLSLANCPISDEGLEVICQSVKYSTSIKTVDFTGCSLTWRGAEHMANIIRHQGMQRHGTAWAESLRYRQPQFEGMGGLRRVTLNCNTLIGDRGAAALAHELAEDLWVKAVDLQRCGLSSEGARRLLEALKTNSALCVLDIRSNPLVDKVLIKTVIEKVLMNADGQSPEYCWIKPAATEPQRASGPKRRALSSTVRGKTTLRIGMSPRKAASPGGRSSGVAQTQKPYSRSHYVPWRAAARAGRQRGMPPGVTVMDQSFQGAATVKVTVESDSEGEEDEDEEEEEGEVVVEVEPRPSSLSLQDRISGRQLERMQMELKECRLRLAEERRARLKAESRLMEYELENTRLRDTNLSLSEALEAAGSSSAPPAFSALEDEAVLESIESSFTKFHAFLDLLKDAGWVSLKPASTLISLWTGTVPVWLLVLNFLFSLFSFLFLPLPNFILLPSGKSQTTCSLGQLASLAGIDKSDFQHLGRPQLSSTIGPHLNGASSLARGECRDVWVKTDDPSLVGNVLPAPPGGPADTTTPRSPLSVRESLHENRQLDVTFTQASGPSVGHGAGGEGEPDRYSKPDTQRDSGSERSLRSHKSFDKVYFGQTFQTQPSHPKSNSSSHRSNSSHGYSFNNSYAHSRASHSNGSLGGLSGRSSVSDIISDKAESVASVGSRNRGQGRLVTMGQSGSEGSDYPGRETLERIKSLDVRSDNDSF